jgi:glycosyltransferase involved in cell wall biosynthesis
MTSQDQVPAAVVVAAYNDNHRLARLLRSIDFLVPAPVEVVVVDDGSRDGTLPLLEAWARRGHRFRAQFVRCPANGGPARARNLGVAAVSQPLVAFTDSDCVVSPDWLGAYSELFARVGGRVAGAGGAVRATRDDLVSRYLVAHHILEPWPQDGRPVLYVVTANACFRRDRFLEVGGFDERIPFAGGEDPGLSFKLLGAGYELRVAREAVVAHDFRPDLLSFVKMFHRYGRGCRYVTEKHLPRSRRLRLAADATPAAPSLGAA